MGALIWVVIAAVALAALYGLDVSRQNIGKAKVRAELAPITEQCKAMGKEDPAKCAVAIRTIITNNQTCEAANKSLGAQIDTIIATHNAEVEFAHQEYLKAKARKTQSAAATAPRLADLAMEKFNLIASATKPGGGMTCEQLDAALLEEAKRKVKFYGPATMPEAPKGGLRIVDEPAPQPARPAAVNPLRPAK